MSMTLAEKQTLDVLLAALRERLIAPEQSAQLKALLREHADARERYLQYQYLCAGLRWLCADDAEAGPMPPQVSLPASMVTPAPVAASRFAPTRRMKQVAAAFMVGSVALIAYIITITWGMFDEQPRSGEQWAATSEQSSENNEQQVAKITATEDARWQASDPTAAIQPSAFSIQHSKIPQGEPLALASGTIALQLKQGVKLLIQGPAEWSVDGDNTATLKHGRLVAQVPPEGVGFTLKTPTARIVDLGTEFGVVVADSGATSLQVLKGEVTLAQSAENSKPERLVAGQARRVRTAESGGTTVVEKIPFEPLQVAVGSPAKPPLDRWREASQVLRADPSLVAYYDFESGGSELKNVLADRLHGEIITSRDKPCWTDGRWHGKGALALGANFASVRVPDAPALHMGERGSLALWFRPDAAPRQKYSLIVAKGSLQECGYSLWLAPNQQVRFLATMTNGQVCKSDSKAPLALNRWHLAVVTMVPGEVSLYIDGELSRMRKTVAPFVTNSEPLQIGRPDDKDGWPVFSGVVDELSLFSRALSAEEITQMYRTGAPD